MEYTLFAKFEDGRCEELNQPKFVGEGIKTREEAIEAAQDAADFIGRENLDRIEILRNGERCAWINGGDTPRFSVLFGYNGDEWPKFDGNSLDEAIKWWGVDWSDNKRAWHCFIRDNSINDGEVVGDYWREGKNGE